MSMKKSAHAVRRLTYSALYLAIALVLPFLTGQIPEIGSMLSPMHIPVLLCGFVCGPLSAMTVGFIAPLLRSLLFGMPKLYPTAIAMMFELAAYGLLAGVICRLLPKKTWAIYAALITAMIGGRVVWGLAELILLDVQGSAFSAAMFIDGAVLNAIPGIILHIVLIPVIVLALKKAGLTLEN